MIECTIKKKKNGSREINDIKIGDVYRLSLAFVLINAAPAREHEVYNKLLKDPKILELHPLFGEYDLIAKIEAKNFEKLGDIVTKRIRSIKGVIDTKTLTGTIF